MNGFLHEFYKKLTQCFFCKDECKYIFTYVVIFNFILKDLCIKEIRSCVVVKVYILYFLMTIKSLSLLLWTSALLYLALCNLKFLYPKNVSATVSHQCKHDQLPMWVKHLCFSGGGLVK